MRILYLILISFIFSFCAAFSKEALFDLPIEFQNDLNCEVSKFCKKYIDDIDIENFIQNEIKNDYVVVSLDECIDITLKNNFDIDLKNHDYKSSKYEYQNALSKFLPVLNTTSYIANYSGQILVGGVLRDAFHETALSINFKAEHRLFDGGQQIFEAKAKKYFERSKKNAYNYSISQSLYYCVKYYYEMLLAKISIEIYLKNLIERNAQLSLAQNLENSGFGTKFDVIRAKNETAQAKLSLLKALTDFRLSQTRLANLMGIKVETALMPFENDIKPLNLVLETQKIEDFYDLAINNREDLKELKNLISYEKQVKNTYVTEFMPKPLVDFQQQFQGTLSTSIKPNYILAGYLYWEPGKNCFMGTITKIKAQKEKIMAKKLEYEIKLRNLKEGIVNSYTQYLFNIKKMDVTKTRLEYSLESVKLAMLRFNNGKGILLDVIEAQSEVTQARVENVSAIIKYNISQADLLFNSGTITRDIIISNYKP